MPAPSPLPARAAFAKFAFFVQNFANFWRARSRLCQNEILQENMRWTALFKLYKMCILLHRCNLKFLAKNRFEKSAITVKFQQNFANYFVKSAKKKICKILPKFQLDTLVDFETCCKTRICLQRSVPIQPKTSDLLPKISQKLAI